MGYEAPKVVLIDAMQDAATRQFGFQPASQNISYGYNGW